MALVAGRQVVLAMKQVQMRGGIAALEALMLVFVWGRKGGAYVRKEPCVYKANSGWKALPVQPSAHCTHWYITAGRSHCFVPGASAPDPPGSPLRVTGEGKMGEALTGGKGAVHGSAQCLAC